MNEDIIKELPEYAQNLPKPVQDVLIHSEWEIRTNEIAQKYSLNENQIDTLVNKVLFVMIGLESPRHFTDTLAEEIDISRLITTQVIEDLNQRVFEYALQFIEKKKLATKSSEKDYGQNEISKNSETALEIPPNTLPVVETQQMENERKNTLEKVRVPVPRYTIPDNLPGAHVVSETVTVETQVDKEKSPEPQMMPRKETVTQTQSPTNTIKPIEKSYTTDPYREPIE